MLSKAQNRKHWATLKKLQNYKIKFKKFGLRKMFLSTYEALIHFICTNDEKLGRILFWGQSRSGLQKVMHRIHL